MQVFIGLSRSKAASLGKSGPYLLLFLQFSLWKVKWQEHVKQLTFYEKMPVFLPRTYLNNTCLILNDTECICFRHLLFSHSCDVILIFVCLFSFFFLNLHSILNKCELVAETQALKNFTQKFKLGFCLEKLEALAVAMRQPCHLAGAEELSLWSGSPQASWSHTIFFSAHFALFYADLLSS